MPITVAGPWPIFTALLASDANAPEWSLPIASLIVVQSLCRKKERVKRRVAKRACFSARRVRSFIEGIRVASIF
jgi:hypothetical protein